MTLRDFVLSHARTEAPMAVNAAGDRKERHWPGSHRAQLCTLAAQLPMLTAAERAQARDRVLRFVREYVAPDMEANKMVLYPAVSERLDDPLIEVSMNYDRLAIRHWMSKIEAADVRDTDRFQRLLYGLDALIRVHIWKQNELLLAVLATSSWRKYGASRGRRGRAAAMIGNGSNPG